jgi:hypothetical protein
MTDQFDLRIRRARGRQTVLGAVKDQHLAIDREGGNDVRVLRLISGLVDLARVVNLLGDVELDDRRLSRRCLAPMAANLAALLVVVTRVGLNKLGNLKLRDLEIVWLSL